MSGPGTEFSFLRLALASLGAGLAVLVVSLPLIWAAGHVHRWLALAVALLAIVSVVAAIGIVANRVVNRAAERITRAQGAPDSQHPDSQHPDSQHPDSQHPDSQHR